MSDEAMDDFDPNSVPEDSSRKLLDAGRQVFSVAGFERYNSNAGNPCVRLSLVCILDTEHAGRNVGRLAKANLTLTKSMQWKLAEFCRSLKWQERFNPLDNEQLSKVTGNCAFVGIVQHNDYTPTSGRNAGKKQQEAVVDEYEVCGVEVDLDSEPYMSIINKALDDYEKFLQRKASRGSRGGGHGGGGSAAKHDENGEGGIPF